MVKVEDYHRHGVLMVSLNHPDNHNALNRELVRELTEVFSSHIDADDVRIVILTGRGKSFCAGADLPGILASSQAGYQEVLDDGYGLFDLMTAISRCPLPVIGRVDGWAIGGGMGLVSCCDLVVASERAMFGFSEVRLGLIPAIITPFVLSRIHVSDARELYLTGERFGAQKALEIGLVDSVVDHGDLDEQVEIWVHGLLQGAPGALAAVKELLRAFVVGDVDQLREFTSNLFANRVVSEEGREGIQAFVEKRNAGWNERQRGTSS